MAKTKERVYYVKGMHCASCEILIEKKLLEFPSIKSAEASMGKGQVVVKFEQAAPAFNELSEIFQKENYVFSDQPFVIHQTKGIFNSLIIALVIIAGFLLLNKFGLARLINVNSFSSLPTFFGFGLLAGISSCAALIGGIILSMSKQWSQLYAPTDSTSTKLAPHLLFNFGRLISYLILGGLLGLIGKKLQLSLTFSSLLVIAISIVMVFLGLQMLGFKSFRRFQFAAPKFITRRIADPKNFSGRYMPFLMGILTFFLPCGFTITVQGLALLSGNFFQGAMIMFFFALGTLAPLLLIGLSSVKFSSNHHLSAQFMKVAGIIVLFFAVFNINAQLNVLGFNFRNLSLGSTQNQTIGQSANLENDLPPIIDGKQVLKMNASSSGYSPRNLKVRAGVPVRWEITDTGTSGCTNAVISRNLFDGEIDLKPGQTSIKEFTPQKPGKYQFSCWMGMVTGTMEVVDAS